MQLSKKTIKDIKAQKYIEKNVLPKLKEDEAPSKKK